MSRREKEEEWRPVGNVRGHKRKHGCMPSIALLEGKVRLVTSPKHLITLLRVTK